MSKFHIGDLVVLKSGSMRMCVEDIAEDSDRVHCIWCHEGNIGRDSFNPALLSKWEAREDNRGGGRPYGGDREGGGKPWRGNDRGDRGDRGDRFGGRDRDGDDRGRPANRGWDGKPREKRHFRKDD